MTGCDKVLRLLEDGRPHTHHEGYRLGVILHSRVSDLRKRGYEIHAWREGRDYVYQLVSSVDGSSIPSPQQGASLAASMHDHPEARGGEPSTDHTSSSEGPVLPASAGGAGVFASPRTPLGAVVGNGDASRVGAAGLNPDRSNGLPAVPANQMSLWGAR